jgi:hypothetical protein
MPGNYLIHGLVISLPFACDELIRAPAGARADVLVQEGEVSRSLPGAVASDATFDSADGCFLLRGGPRSARFLVQDGRLVTFSKNRYCEGALFFHHLLYPVMAAILRQRRLLPLHASCATNDQGAVLVTGPSGAGKSTTISQLVARGWRLLADDLCALQLNQGGGLDVLPGTERVHLHEDALARLDCESDHLHRHDWHRQKAALPLPAQRRASPLSRIISLDHTDASRIEVRKVNGQDRLAMLLAALYGPMLPTEIQAASTVFLRSLERVEITLILRPRGLWSMDEVLEHITDV